MKAIILFRVSTNDQQEGHSIGAQKARLRQYCERKDLNVIKEFEIIESSTQGKRKDFNEMLEFIKRQKETIALVADKVDRVQRSLDYKLRNGECIRKAPVGYLNIKDQHGKSDVIVDVQRAYLVKKLFIEYAKGTTSFQGLEKNAKNGA